MPEPSKKRRWLLRGAAVVVAVLAGYMVVVGFQVWSASRVDAREPADAIVVLGAAQYDGRPSPALQRRLDHALELYEEGLAPRIVLTGSKRPGDRFTEAYTGYRYLARAGVPESALTIVADGANTYESLAATRRVLREDGDDRVLLVSDGYHNRRLIGIAKELGMDPLVASATTGVTPTQLMSETGKVAAGDIIGYRRLTNLLS